CHSRSHAQRVRILATALAPRSRTSVGRTLALRRRGIGTRLAAETALPPLPAIRIVAPGTIPGYPRHFRLLSSQQPPSRSLARKMPGRTTWHRHSATTVRRRRDDRGSQTLGQRPDSRVVHRPPVVL